MTYNPATFHEPDLNCYACGHAYSFLGEEPHKGVCPECGSSATTPAGELTLSGEVLGQETMHNANFLDGADRMWTYYFAHRPEEHELVISGIRIADQRLTPSNPVWEEVPVPERLVDAAAEAGLLDDVDASREEYTVRRVVTDAPGTGRGGTEGNGR